MNQNSSSHNSKKSLPPPAYLNFGFAFVGASVATAFCHPFDVARVRSQVTGNGKGWARELFVVARAEGPKALWVGLSAGLLRQAFYGTARFGAFETLQDWRRAQLQGSISPMDKALCGVLAGGFAGLMGNPADVALTRMTSDLKLPEKERRGYSNGLVAMLRIGREEGLVRGLMCGVVANIQRSVIVNLVMLGSYAQSKEEIQVRTGLESNSPLLQFLAGNIAGFATAVFAVPADGIKTKLQHALPGQYAGAWDLITQTVRQRGIQGLWSGFFPFWFKLAPHTTITFMIIENLREVWSKS